MMDNDSVLLFLTSRRCAARNYYKVWAWQPAAARPTLYNSEMSWAAMYNSEMPATPICNGEMLQAAICLQADVMPLLPSAQLPQAEQHWRYWIYGWHGEQVIQE